MRVNVIALQIIYVKKNVIMKIVKKKKEFVACIMDILKYINVISLIIFVDQNAKLIIAKKIVQKNWNIQIKNITVYKNISVEKYVV